MLWYQLVVLGYRAGSQEAVLLLAGHEHLLILHDFWSPNSYSHLLNLGLLSIYKQGTLLVYWKASKPLIYKYFVIYMI